MDSGQPPTRASYRDLWYAAVAVIEMCVKDNKSGWTTGLGEQPFFYPNEMDLGWRHPWN